MICPSCYHTFIASEETEILLPIEPKAPEAPKPVEQNTDHEKPTSNAGPFTLISVVLAITIMGLIAFIFMTHERTPTGYETTTKFVEDGDYTDSKEFEEMMTEGWEVMHERRAWSARYSYTDEYKDWGSEYTMRKPKYN